MITNYHLMINKDDSTHEFEIWNYSMICFHNIIWKLPDEKTIYYQVKSSWILKRHMQSSHTIQDLEEFDSLHKKIGKEKSLNHYYLNAS